MRGQGIRLCNTTLFSQIHQPGLVYPRRCVPFMDRDTYRASLFRRRERKEYCRKHTKVTELFSPASAWKFEFGDFFV